MSSYLDQFNYQFLSGGADGTAKRWTLAEVQAENASPGLTRWVFLHGLMGYAINWRKITTLMGPNDLCFIFDQRGHGHSLKPSHGYAPEDYADDLKRLVDEIGWSKFNLVGHSMGARNALVYASRYAESLNLLVLEDLGPEGSDEALPYYQRLLDAVPTPFASKREAKEFFMNDFRQVPVRGDRETIGLYFYSNIVETPDGRADWRFSKQAILDSVRQGRAKDHWNEFRALSMPTLIIRGSESAELSREIFQKMGYANPRAELVEIADAGHWVHYDQPEKFVEALKSFAMKST